jgi:signal transduction histidine kinase/ligand-binding sensor domain-containing protein
LSPRYNVRVWKGEDGLPQNSVIAMTQTRDGYLWLGTGNGLARFDGQHFKTYEEADIPGLSGSKVVRLFEDSHRNLWIGTEKAGVFLVNREGAITNISLGPTGPVTGICEDPAGGVWLRLANFQIFRYLDGVASLITDNSICLGSDGSGSIWLGSPERNGSTTNKLARLGPIQKSAPSAIPYLETTLVGHVDYLLASKTGGFWLLANGHVFKCKATGGTERDLGRYPWGGQNPWSTPVLAACEDREGNLIVGTYGDGVYWYRADGTAEQLKELAHSYVYSLIVDSEGSLWVGTDRGLNRVRQQSFEVIEGPEDSKVTSVCESHDGSIWIGYNDECIGHLIGGVLRQFTNLWPDVEKSFLQVHSIFEDKDGRVLAGVLKSSYSSPCLLSFQKDRFKAVANIPPALCTEVSVIFQDRAGALWVGTQSGLAKWDGGHWNVLTSREGLSSDKIRALAQDMDGHLWIGTEQGGLCWLHDGTVTSFRKQRKDGLPSDDISSLYAETNGVLWVGTTYSGLARFYRGKWTRYTTEDGLASNRIGYLLDDGLGNLWLGSITGLMRVSKSDLMDFADGKVQSIACRTFGPSDGLPTAECSSGSQPGACRTHDGRLLFPTISGLASLNPAMLTRNTNPPPVVIESVRVDNELQNSDALRAPFPQAVTVPAGKETLEIDFTTLNLSAPEKVLFKYRLEGHEKALSAWDKDTKAKYTKLPPGSYRFHVIACNEDHVVNETGAYLAVTIQPPFWRKPWFIATTSLCLLALIVSIVHYVSTQRLQRELATMRQHEALEKERARIARDLHDQLGANLTQVALLGEMAEADKELPGEVETHARQISHTARETTHALDEIVWTVNPSNDTLDGLINYICKYAQEYLALAELRYRLEVPSQLPATPISPELRHNVFLVAKEAVNNIVKHAHASSAWLRLQLDSDRFVLEIEDDGKGLPPGAEKKGRNGLRNMQKRMEDIGGNFELGARTEGGTRIRLIVPLK